MDVGYRVFIINDDVVTALSQKKFNDFALRHIKALPQFANQTLHIAIVIYALEKKKPKQIIRIDSQRMRVDGDGGLDEEFEHDGMRLIANKVDAFFGAAQPEIESGGSVVHAMSKFDARRDAHRHPSLSGTAHKRILEILFK